MTTNDIIRNATHYPNAGFYVTEVNDIVINFTGVKFKNNMFKFYLGDTLIACVNKRAIKTYQGGCNNGQQQA